MFFFLDKKERKNQEKVIGLRAWPDTAPLPFQAHAPLLISVHRTENVT
jgi:hypothetical protein